jgi:predicted permease
MDRAVYSSWSSGINVVANGHATHVQQQRVSARYFDVLGVRPAIGRSFRDDEDRTGGPAAAILSHGLWTSLFGQDPSIVGGTMEIRGEPATIVGVMPAGFHTGTKADVWTPLRPSTRGEGENENYTILVRLHPTTTWPQAEAEIRRIGEEIVRQQANRQRRALAFSVVPLQQSITEGLRQPLAMLAAAVTIVLVVACVNLAGLLLARSVTRSREIATRMALGSGAGAVTRQLFIESVLLAALGGIASVPVTYAVLEGLRRLATDALDIWQPVTLDGRAVAAAISLSALATAIFGLVPALRAVRTDVQTNLTGGSTRSVAGGSHQWTRRAIVVAQVALGVVLLVGAGLLVRSFAHLRGLTPGFDPDGLVVARVSLQDARYRTAARVTTTMDEALRRMQSIPGIESAAVSLGVPYTRLLNLGFRTSDGRTGTTTATYVSPQYFATMRIPVRRGRAFDSRDTASSQPVVIVSDTFARTHFADRDPIGTRVAVAGGEREIVGIVGDVQVRPPSGDRPLAAMPVAYVPLTQVSDGFVRLVHGWFAPAFVVRSAQGLDTIAPSMRRALAAADPLLPFADVRDMRDLQSASIAEQRFLMAILAVLAGAAVLLASLGIHGLIAASVAERTREMGIRLALGAPPRTAVRALAEPGIVLAGCGIAIGVAVALTATRAVRHVVFGITATDPATFLAVAGLFLAVAVLASVAPALRVLRLDPAMTLRQD